MTERTVKETVREYDKDGKLVKETVKETTEKTEEPSQSPVLTTTPYYPYNPWDHVIYTNQPRPWWEYGLTTGKPSWMCDLATTSAEAKTSQNTETELWSSNDLSEIGFLATAQ